MENKEHSSSRWLVAVVIITLAAFPWAATALGQEFYIGFARRVLIFSLAATSLNFILGYGGMVALGHAGFVGIGAYAVVILVDAGVTSAWLLWTIGMLAAALGAAAIGAISLRTRGVYFIMITLAFAQMLYYVFVSLRTYGGDDGYTLQARPNLPFGLDGGGESALYWVVLAMVVVVLWAYSRAIDSRFGHALTGIRDNETRMSALGYPVYRLRLVAFTLSGGAAGMAGAMLATHNGYVGPGLMHWTQSATILIMVVLGGAGRRWGGVIGAAVWLLLEEAFKLGTEYWHMPLGLLLIAVALYAPRGVSAMVSSTGAKAWFAARRKAS